MPKPLPTAVAVVVVAGLAAGGYFAFRHFRPASATNTPITGNAPHARQAREVPAVTFTDVTAASGINFRHQNGYSGFKLLPETMGGGVAVIDYDGDGKPDLLFVGGRPWPGFEPPGAVPESSLKLYRNLGDWKFEDVTQQVGLNVGLYGMGVAVGDFD
ncbi:MAG: VCBS repeat-containing protein, partial [Gemmataceae bacterium]|nr:VCBS repeat-containing protein [Gemmataceae bacterium]